MLHAAALPTFPSSSSPTTSVHRSLSWSSSNNHATASFFPFGLSLLPTPLTSPRLLRPIQAKSETTPQGHRTSRHVRIRKKVEGTPERPRLSVFRSNKHLYVQVIDDTKMHTLASASTMQKPMCEEFEFSAGPTIEIAKKIGAAIAKSCLEKGITKVAFDRGGFLYHGRIRALADAARENGLQF